VLREPRAQVRFLGFGASALDFELLAWVRDPAAQDRIKSDLYHQIEANFDRAGVVVPFPQMVLHLPPDEVDAIAARLRGEVPAASPMRATQPDAPRDQNAPAFQSPAWSAAGLDAIAARMRGPDGIAIADRRHLLQRYPRCFVGAEAVDWLARTQECSRDEAVRLGQTLVERGIIHHVLDEHPFRDGQFYYRFYVDEQMAREARSA
jgi:hypothetical protein